ncbi:MAG: hypothetical protein ACKVVP_13165 [Chloroflexota bacterium]
MDDLPAIVSPRSAKTSTVISPTEPKPEPEASVPTYVRTVSAGRRGRVTTRYPFEFFQDQIETLRKLSLEEKMRGERGSMSEMAREAFDMYITKRLGRDT